MRVYVSLIIWSIFLKYGFRTETGLCSAGFFYHSFMAPLKEAFFKASLKHPVFSQSHFLDPKNDPSFGCFDQTYCFLTKTVSDHPWCSVKRLNHWNQWFRALNKTSQKWGHFQTRFLSVLTKILSKMSSKWGNLTDNFFTPIFPIGGTSMREISLIETPRYFNYRCFTGFELYFSSFSWIYR